MKKHTIKKGILEICLLLIVGVVNVFIFCPKCYRDQNKILSSIGISCLLWVLMYKGNYYTSNLIDRYYSWLQEPVKRLIIGVLGHTIFTSLTAFLIIFLIEKTFDVQFSNIPETIIYSIGVSLLVSLILSSRRFLLSWKNIAIESEKMKKEAVTSKYETLKNQVNPHFLFNSLNALTNLVYDDQDKAAKFIKMLSEVYRYILETKDQELVALSTELEFLNSYIFLQKIRYEENLKFQIKIVKAGQFKIVPLSLQMLVENAIKHNIISADQPLNIEIWLEKDFLIVSNNLQKKNTLKEESSKTGLDNIKARYTFLTQRQVEIIQEDHQFKVKLPLLP